jgi:2-desacetyl-2-hydroxyethyl bacteriochlorophyllide A dehydrogenase
MRAKAILFTGVDRVEVGETEVPEPGPGEVLISAFYTCVSPGTELRCLAGKQQGAASWPFIPGYSLSGTVTDCGPDTTLRPGARVFCTGTARADRNLTWGGHVSHAVRREADIFPVPDGVSMLEASAAKLSAIAYRGVCLSRPLPHEVVAVVGLGMVGQLSARLHALSGARVVAADLSERRVEVARGGGVEAFVPRGDLAGSFAELLPEGADVVVDATGSPGVLPGAIGIARDTPRGDPPLPGARYIVQGSYPGDFSIPYQEAFGKELTFALPRDTRPRDIRVALDFMAHGKLRVPDLIEPRPPEEAPDAYAALREAGDGPLTVAFGWR